ncbi:MAG: MazG nucleotide pyrophosphohydrolase domain-containing protein [Oleiphilus sp.]
MPENEPQKEPRASESNRSEAILSTISAGISSMEKAIQLQQKAAEHGFDWPSISPVFDKLQEEIKELQHEIAHAAQPNAVSSAQAKIQDELGDVIFCCMNLARCLKINPHQALESTNSKFERRFNFIEQTFKAKGQTLKDASLDELDQVWEQAKRRGL